MFMRPAFIRAGFVLLFTVVAVALAQYQPTPAATVYASQGELATFIDKPSDAIETYSGSGIYKRASISPEIEAAIRTQSQEDWEKYHIAKESNLGLPLGSVFLQAKNGKYVELALYERAAFTVFKGKPARQILSTIIFEGKVQVTEDEFISVPSYLRNTFAGLPIAGEGDQSTPLVGAVAKLLSTDKAKAVDVGWSKTDQLFRWDGTFVAPDSNLKVEPLPLGQPDTTTGHRVPDVMSMGLSNLFGEKVVENAGLPLSPTLWILAQVKGEQTLVCVQVFQRAIVTYNPANDEANRVQVGLGGGIVYGGLTIATVPATPTSLATATPPFIGIKVTYSRGELRFQDEYPGINGPRLRITNETALAELLDRVVNLTHPGTHRIDFVAINRGFTGDFPERGTYNNKGARYAAGCVCNTKHGNIGVMVSISDDNKLFYYEFPTFNGSTNIGAATIAALNDAETQKQVSGTLLRWLMDSIGGSNNEALPNPGVRDLIAGDSSKGIPNLQHLLGYFPKSEDERWNYIPISLYLP
jgi:hypothetical protein